MPQVMFSRVMFEVMSSGNDVSGDVISEERHWRAQGGAVPDEILLMKVTS